MAAAIWATSRPYGFPGGADMWPIVFDTHDHVFHVVALGP